MGRPSKYQQRLVEEFKTWPYFTAAEAERMGIPRQTLSYFTSRGVLERISHGYYRLSSVTFEVDVLFEDLVIIASTIPNSVICLISALRYHDLTEEIQRSYWIAVVNSQRAPIRPHTRVVRMRDIKLGRQTKKIAGIKVRIFDAERCVVDAFRYLSQEIAIKALKMYLMERPEKPNIPKLVRYAEMLRVNLDPYIASIIT